MMLTESSTTTTTIINNNTTSSTGSNGSSSHHGNINNNKRVESVEECSSSKEREARSVALEKAYVHDIYQNIACHFSDSRYRAWPKVKQFLLDLEPGSVVCDVGCGNGKYLSFNPSIYKIGLDRCSNLTGIAREKDDKKEVLICDNLALPFRDECFDAVLSIAVIHHFATTERRVAAIKELARVLRIGGRLMVSVWAMEQRHRKFESQDVLVPWNRPLTSSSDDKTSSIERDLNSTTTTTSDDDATHYHAYTQTSDSDSFPSLSVGCRKRGRGKHRGRSIDQNCPSSSQSSSDLSSPNESCYSFVRRALQKIAGGRRGRRPWFLQDFDLPRQEGNDPLASIEDDVALEYGNVNNPADPFMPIELRQLESTEFAELLQDDSKRNKQNRGLLFSNVLYPRRRTLEIACQLQQSNTSHIGAQPKSKSLSDLFGLIPVRLNRKSTEDLKKKGGINQQQQQQHHQLNIGQQQQQNKEVIRSQSSLSGIISSNDDDIEVSDCVRHKAVQTESLESLNSTGGGHLDSNSSSSSNVLSNFKNEFSTSIAGGQQQDMMTMTHQDKTMGVGSKKFRPTLVKQKHSICSSSSALQNTMTGGGGGSDKEEQDEFHLLNPLESKTFNEKEDCWGEIKQSVKDLPEFKQNHHHSQHNNNSSSNSNNYRAKQTSSVRAALAGSSFWKHSLHHNMEEKSYECTHSTSKFSTKHFWKQTSLNEELIFSERLKEKERLKQHIQKQCSLNEELIYRQRENNTRWDQMKEAFLNSSNVKCLQLLKHGLSSRFRGTSSSNSSNNSGSNGYSGGGGLGSDTNNSNTDNTGSPLSTSGGSLPSGTPRQGPYQSTSSLRNGLVRMLQNWKQGDEANSSSSSSSASSNNNATNNSSSSSSTFLNTRRGSKEGSGGGGTRRGLFPPFFLRRSSAGSLNLVKINKDMNDPSGTGPSTQVLSPPYLKRRPSDVELLHDGNGNKLLPGVRHVRKLSREDGSDSSKDSSFQSDTSVDSEDSFASVIFIPKTTSMDNNAGVGGGDSETRANSTDSDRSPKSPASRLSPPNHNVPKSPSPLASEILYRRSPEASPTRMSLYGTSASTSSSSSTMLETTKFIFDESATNVATSSFSSFMSSSSSSSISNNPISSMMIPERDESVVIGCSSSSSSNINNNNASTTLASVAEEESPSTFDKPIVIAPPKKEKIEKIEVLRKPAVLPDQKSSITRQLVRRSLPKVLAVELFNPETDDADTSDTSSSSPNSVSSVVSVVNDDSWNVVGPTNTTSGGGGANGTGVDNISSKSDDSNLIPSTNTPPPNNNNTSQVGGGGSQVILTQRSLSTDSTKDTAELEEDPQPPLLPSIAEDSCPTTSDVDAASSLPPRTSERKLSSSGILEAAAHVVSSLENLVTQSSPKARRKFTLARLGSTSEWLSNISSCDAGVPPPPSSSHSSHSHQSHSTSAAANNNSGSGSSSNVSHKRHHSIERRNPGEKILIGEGKKASKGPDAKWPSSIIDESPPQTAKLADDEFPPSINSMPSTAPTMADASQTQGMTTAHMMTAQMIEEMEEKDSLYDSMENLTNNPSIDSSVRMSSGRDMSSTCSCSIRGGDSFDSWTSAKSSLTNSSSNQHKTSFPSLIPLQIPSSANNKPTCLGGAGPVGKLRGPGSSKTFAVEDAEDSAPLTYHRDSESEREVYYRYFHVSGEGELDKLIEKYVQNLHIISSYYDHYNWCIIAERVNCWTI